MPTTAEKHLAYELIALTDSIIARAKAVAYGINADWDQPTIAYDVEKLRAKAEELANHYRDE